MWVRSPTTSQHYSVRQAWLLHKTIQHHSVQPSTTKWQSPKMWTVGPCVPCQLCRLPGNLQQRDRSLPGDTTQITPEESSTIGEHIGAHNHSFAPEAVTVKCKEKDRFGRGIAKAIWIAKENLLLNRDRGMHTLLPVYNQLMSSHDTHTTQGSRDDAENADKWRTP